MSFFLVVSHNQIETTTSWNTMEKILLWCGIQQKKVPALCYTAEEKFLRCGIQRKKFVKHPVTVPHISHIEGKPFPLYPITEENRLHGIPQWQKN